MVVTRRRSAAIAMDRSRSSGIVSIDKSPAPPLGKTVKCSATGKSTKKTRSVESTSIVREKVITERTTHEQQSLNKTLPAKSLVDEVEPWEVLPKTGYTYAKSPSYSQRYLDQDWIIPNMSRPRLRSRVSSVTVSGSPTSTTAEILSSSQISNYAHQQTVHTESHQETYSGSSSWQNRKNIDISEKELTEENVSQADRLAPSVTRSGRRSLATRKSSRLGTSSAGRNVSSRIMSVEEYMHLEKDMEYSGQSVPFKESPRLTLFGLDQADECDVSDTETNFHRSIVISSQSQSISSSFFGSFVTSIFTLFTYIATVSWKIVTTPVWWLVHSVGAILGSRIFSTESTSTKSEHTTIYDEYIGKNHATATEESHSNSLLEEQIQYTQDHCDITEQVSDGEFSDFSMHQSENHSHKTAYQLAEETSGNEDSWCFHFFYGLIAVSYLLFIALPTGLFKAVKTVTIWLMTYILLPVVDSTRSLAMRGYTSLASSLSCLRHVYSTSDSTETSKDSDITVALSENPPVGWLTTLTYCRNKAWSALCTAAQMVAVMLWILLAAITNGLYHGFCGGLCWRLGSWIHQVTANVLLFDVWLHSRSRERRGCCCLLPLLLLLLIPLLLLLASDDKWLAAVTKDKSYVNMVISDETETGKSAGMSYAALREIIGQELAGAKADLKVYNTDLYKENLAYIQTLENSLKDCCKSDAVLAGMISSSVQEQLAVMMHGTTSGGGGDGDGGDGAASRTAFVNWFESHFSKSAAFDAKVAALTETLNANLKKQSETNRAALVAATQAEQMALEANMKSEQAAKIAAAVEEAQSEHVWVKDKTRLETMIANIATDLKKTDANVAKASALAAVANDNAAEAMKTAAAMSTVHSTAQGCANDVKVGMGCSTSQVVVEPGDYQLVTEDQVKLLIREALGIFGADKTGMVDYALESAGGSVISTRCSETYHRRTAQLSLFGFPLWYVSNSPRTVIQPEVQPGQCWAFKGSQGYIVIQLAGWVKPTSFTIEHIPKSLSPTGKIDSAPKDFTVWGLKFERDTDGQLLGNYTYLDNNEPLQFFQVQKPNVGAFHIVELRIHSNHGNQEYTCLYRFRVHGVLTKL